MTATTITLPSTWTQMNRESAAIEAVAWEEDVLFVAFKKATYAYIGVSLDLYQEFLVAPSAGNFLNAVIKGHFDFERVL